MNIPESKIAVTLFNLRDYCQNEDDFAATLERVREMGYEAIQYSAVPLEADVARKRLDEFGLYCCATHENLATISGDPKVLIDRLQTLGCDFTALGHPGAGYDYASAAAVNKMADIFKRAGDALGEAGIKLGYHNHAKELTKIEGTRVTMLEEFMKLTAGYNVWSELDVHWVTRGGGSPADWIGKFASRISVIHFKDFAVVDGEPHICEIGMGNLDWPEILKTCEATGVRWYSIEQDVEFPGRNIFDSVKMSIDNLHAMGVK